MKINKEIETYMLMVEAGIKLMQEQLKQNEKDPHLYETISSVIIAGKKLFVVLSQMKESNSSVHTAVSMYKEMVDEEIEHIQAHKVADTVEDTIGKALGEAMKKIPGIKVVRVETKIFKKKPDVKSKHVVN